MHRLEALVAALLKVGALLATQTVAALFAALLKVVALLAALKVLLDFVVM